MRSFGLTNLHRRALAKFVEVVHPREEKTEVWCLGVPVCNQKSWENCMPKSMLGSFEGGSIGQDMAKMDKLLKGAANPSQAILSCTQWPRCRKAYPFIQPFMAWAKRQGRCYTTSSPNLRPSWKHVPPCATQIWNQLLGTLAEGQARDWRSTSLSWTDLLFFHYNIAIV